jgi:hypothetical protein
MPLQTSLNVNEKLEFFQADSPEELKTFIKSVRLPLYIVSIYSVGSKHIAWFLTDARIKRTKKEGKKNGSIDQTQEG